MPKSIWNGTITFGLVNVPVKLYAATESKTVRFNDVHARDGARIERLRICPKEDREVPYEEIVKGCEVDESSFVVREGRGKDAGIRGRSKMSKDEPVKALEE